MEFRTLRSDEREALLTLLNGWELPDGWRGQDFFRRYIDFDPTYQDENVWVAEESGDLVACVQIFPRRIRILGHAIPAGGLGSVFTAASHRRRGISDQLLEIAVNAMVEREMEVSVLLAALTDFYARHGWRGWPTERSVLNRSSAVPPGGAMDQSPIEVAAFDRDRDFASVKAIHSAYSASRNGTIVRDDALWDASLRLAGNPAEEFLVARRGDTTVAYLRCALLGGVLTITELARREDAPVPLALLVSRILEPHDDDALAPAGLSSGELRSTVLLPAFDDLAFTVALEHRGLAAHPVEDPTTMLRCLNMPALAKRLDIALFPDEEADEFLKRILPRDSLVFWPADRF